MNKLSKVLLGCFISLSMISLSGCQRNPNIDPSIINNNKDNSGGNSGGNQTNSQTITLNIKDFASSNSWVAGNKYNSFTYQGVTFSTNTGNDNGKYTISGENYQWRIYSSQKGVVTISSGSNIASVTFSYYSAESGKNAQFSYNNLSYSSTQSIPVNATTGSFAITTGKAWINSITVVLGSGSGSGSGNTGDNTSGDNTGENTGGNTGGGGIITGNGYNVTFNIADIAEENDWNNYAICNELTNGHVKATMVGQNGSSNTGKYSSGKYEWRMYSSEQSKLTISTDNSDTITSVTYTVTSGTGQGSSLTYGNNTVTANAEIAVNATSMSLIAKTSKVFITNILVKVNGGGTDIGTIAVGEAIGGSETGGGGSGSGGSGGSSSSDYDHSQDEAYTGTKYKGLPSTGDVKALVLPVQFSNDKFTTQELSNLNIALNGTSEQTGWQSVNSYYKISSYNKLNLTFDVADTYTINQTVSNFESSYKSYLNSYNQYTGYYSKDNPIDTLINTILSLNDSNYDYSDYDYNNDGLIDGVYVCYSCSMDYDDEETAYWAWTDLCFVDTDFDNVEVGFYVWFSIDFLAEAISEENKQDIYVTINSQTIVHETGHMLGIDDFYDYDEKNGEDGGIGGGDMMDYNVGDHNVATKLYLGWLNESNINVVSSTQTITIGGMSQTGNAIIVKKNSSISGFNTEYLLIDLYVKDDELSGINDGYHGLATSTVVRIYHVNDEVLANNKQYDYWPFSIYKWDNSYTTYKRIELVEADQNSSITSDNYATNSDYFISGKTLSATAKVWNDNSSLGFSVSVDSINTTNNTATITITFN